MKLPLFIVLLWTMPLQIFGAVGPGRQCGTPDEDIPNAHWIGRRRLYPYNMTVPYRCDNGYSARWSNPPSATCSGGSQWILRNVDNCQLISCGYPPDLEHGYYDSDDFSVAETVVYHCDEGFRLEGRSTARCMVDGKWGMDRNPTCVAEDCDIAESIANGHISNINVMHSPGENIVTATLMCDLRYTVHGGVERQTQRHCANGKWDGQLACQALQCLLSPPVNGYIIDMPKGRSGFGRLAHTEPIYYGCDSGYVLQGEDYNVCLESGTWMFPVLPICQARRCEVPVSNHLKVNVTVDYITFPHGVRFSCEGDYSLRGVTETRCNNKGRLEDDLPSCKAMCHLKEHKNTRYEQVNGDVITDNHVMDGMVVVVDCINEYYLKKNDDYFMGTCDNGVWKGTDNQGNKGGKTYQKLFYCHDRSTGEKISDWWCQKTEWC